MKKNILVLGSSGQIGYHLCQYLEKEKYKVFKKVSTRYELPDGTKEFGKTIMNNPNKYFTEDVMSILDEAAKKEFMYGLSTDTE